MLKVSKKEIVIRGLKNQCPNCGHHTLFERGLQLYRNCPQCDLSFDRGEGFFLGSMSINYGITIIVYLIPVLMLAVRGVLDTEVAIVIGLIGAILFPILFYRSSRSWWLMAYFYFLPLELPANRPDGADDPDPDKVEIPAGGQ